MPAKNNNALIEKLVEASLDLKSMISVHDQRITGHDKSIDSIGVYIEKRREEMDIKLKDVYDTMRSQDNHIIEEITKLRTESNEAHRQLSEKINEKIEGLGGKINKLERYVWMAIGGGIVASYIVSTLLSYFKLLGH